jgi:hypothetical protein
MALALRLGYAFALNSWRPSFVWDGDAKQYQSYAVHLIHQGRYEDDHDDRIFRMPGYPIFLASIYRIFGESTILVQFAQAVLGSFACVLLFFIGGHLYGEGWGLFCGLSAAILYDLIEPSGQILSEALAIPLLAFFWWIWFCWEKPPTTKSSVLAFICALLCLVRPDFGLFGTVLCLGWPFFFLKDGQKKIKGWIWALVCFAVFSPWIARNFILFNEVIPTSSNTENATYMGLALPLEQIHDIPISKRAPTSMNELAARSFYKQEYSALWKSTPTFKIVRAYLINLIALFYPFLPSYDWTYMLFAPLWMWAFFRIREHPQLNPLWLMIGLYVLVHVFVGGPVSRYRQVLSVPLILAATAGAMDISTRFGRRFWFWFGSWAALNIAIWLGAPLAREAILSLAHILRIHA